MSRTTKNQRKKFVRVFLEYGIYIWALIFITNLVVYYSFSFFIRASTDTSFNPNPAELGQISTESDLIAAGTDSITAGLEPTPEATSPATNIQMPIPTATGPVVSISFSLPGIGTNGGNLKPIRLTRDVEIALYSPDANTAARNVRPLHTIKTQATYDTDPNSPTYTSFVNTYVDLGKVVGERSRFQFTLKTPQTLMQLIKEPGSNSPGGKIFSTPNFKSIALKLPHQVMISGDIYPVPNSNNVMDINDYNMLVNCFSNKAASSKCISGSTADLDDNGVVDGVDYNIMLLSFRSLLAQGLPVPSLFTPKPVAINPIISTPISRLKLPVRKATKQPPTPTEKVKISPTNAPQKPSKGGGANILLILFGFLVFIGIIIFVAFKLHLLDKILNKVGKGNPPMQTPGSPDQIGADLGQTQADIPVDNSSIPTDVSPPDTEVENASGSTLPTPIKSGPRTNFTQSAPATVFSDTPSQTPLESGAAASSATDISGTIEKSGYLKKVSVDSESNGTWVTLADDSGITRGFYKGANVTDGFVKIKGTMENDKENKPYILITELIPEG